MSQFKIVLGTRSVILSNPKTEPGQKPRIDFHVVDEPSRSVFVPAEGLPSRPADVVIESHSAQAAAVLVLKAIHHYFECANQLGQGTVDQALVEAMLSQMGELERGLGLEMANRRRVAKETFQALGETVDKEKLQ